MPRDKQDGITNPSGVKEKAEDNCVRSKLVQPAAESGNERYCYYGVTHKFDTTIGGGSLHSIRLVVLQRT